MGRQRLLRGVMERMMGTREGLRELGTGYRVRAHQGS